MTRIVNNPNVRVLTNKQRSRILHILKGATKDGDRKALFYEMRAGRLMREFNHLLGFSATANVLYRDICGYMGQSRGRANDEAEIGIDVMCRWTGRKKRWVEAFIRELTLTGSVPLLEKRVQGGLPARRNVYGFVLEPFQLAERQALKALAAKPGDRNVAKRPLIRFIENTEGTGCPKEEQIERFAEADGEPAYGDDYTAEYYWMRDHVAACPDCGKRLNWALRRDLRAAS